MKTYGPYIRKDGRKHIVIIYDDGRRQTKSYPRFLLEQKIGRELLPEETVDHIDEDFTNDDLDNLQILSLAENARKAMLKRPAEYSSHICPECKTPFTKRAYQVKRTIKKGKSGPFCSRSCAGKATYVNPWK